METLILREGGVWERDSTRKHLGVLEVFLSLSNNLCKGQTNSLSLSSLMDLEKILRDIEEQLEALPDESLPPIPPFNEDQNLSYAKVSISNFFLAMFLQELVTSLAWHFSTTAIKGDS